MAINFPDTSANNPATGVAWAIGDTFVSGTITYKWDGVKWISLGVTPTDRLIEGSNNLQINASNNLVWTGNNVGIGTNNPATKLVIAESDSTAADIRFQNSSTGYASNNGMWVGINNNEDGLVYNYHNSPLIFGTNDTERLRIDSSGDTTLGKYTAPTTNGAISSQTLNFIGGGWNTNNGANEVGTKLQSQHAYWTGNYTSAFGQTYPDFKILIKNSDSATYDEKFAFSGNGVMRLQSGGGINFNNYGQEANINSNLLNDYEEGSWTPDFESRTSAAPNIQEGQYRKIGSQVFAYFHLNCNVALTSSVTNMRITGLPFPAKSGGSVYGCVSTMHMNNSFTVANDEAFLNGLVPPSASYVDMYFNRAGAMISFPNTRFGTGNLLGCVIYFVA